MDKIVNLFDKGTYNLIDSEIIPDGASKDSSNFVNKDGKVILVGGRTSLGSEGIAGSITGLWLGYTPQGNNVYYAKMGDKIMYFDGSDWADTGITGFSSTEEVVFANYSSLAGSFTFVSGIGGLWKINNIFPASPIDVYYSTKNFKGYILIDKGRSLLWNREKDKTGLYGSWIDRQDSSNYTSVEEAIYMTGGATLTGTLGFKAGGARRNCFGLTIDIGGVEVFTDNYDGTLTGNIGGTGTINYATGDYSITPHTSPTEISMTASTISFTADGDIEDSASGFITAGFTGQPYIEVSGSTHNDGIYKVLGVYADKLLTSATFTAESAGASITIKTVIDASYQYEDSSIKGVTDFSHSATRIAGEGFQFPQDEGGDAILKVEVGQDGAYYSLKEKSCYKLSIDSDDVNGDNLVFRKDMGLPYFRASVASNRGIVFMNTSNPTKPELTILQKSTVSLDVEPKVLFTHFDFSAYEYDTCGFGTYDRWILVFCKSKGADANDTILVCSIQDKTVNVVNYTGKMSIQNDSKLYVGDSITRSVYSIFDGFDDLSLPINSYWKSKDYLFNTENLKKLRRLRVKGFIDPDQEVEIYADVDDSGYQLVGEVCGNGSYVNYNEVQTIGSNFIGESQVGGDDITNTYGYYMELRLKLGKFRKVSLMFLPKKIGYFDFNLINFWNILLFEARIPKAYRSKKL